MTFTEQWLSDDTWAAVDPNIGRLPRGQRRTVALLVALAFLVALVPVFAAASGLTDPKIALWPRETTVDRSTASFTVHWQVASLDWFPETVTGLAVKDAAVSITGLVPSRVTVPARGSRLLAVTFHVDDCREPSGSSMLVELRLARPWGTQTLDLVTEQVDHIVTRYQRDVFMYGAAALACGR